MAVCADERQIHKLCATFGSQRRDRNGVMALDETVAMLAVRAGEVESAALTRESSLGLEDLLLLLLDQRTVALPDAMDPGEDTPLRGIGDVLLVDVRVSRSDHSEVRANCVGRDLEAILVARELVPCRLVASSSSGHALRLGIRVYRYKVVDL